ncbi:MAG: glutamine--fructose-6-phosphate transaminase (isomerizing), partial [Chloroflexota bacterium]
MCGIIGYIGNREALPILVESLGRLEYRGYDSCGIAVYGDKIKVYKDAVTIEKLGKTLPHLGEKIGIGHTRWATHGEPSRINAHPHLDCTGRIAVVHNGIITNYEILREELTREGHRFVSGTDTEVIPHLIEKYYQGNPEEALNKTLARLQGSYAIAVMVEGERELVVARKDSPLVIGIGDGENFAASDVPAILGYTKKAIYLDDGEIAVLTPGQVRVTKCGKEIAKTEHRIRWNTEDAQKGGYEHFML